MSAPAKFAPSETALVLLDFHNAIIDSIPSPDVHEKLVSAAKQLLSTARQNGVRVVHGLIDFKSEPRPSSKLKERWETSFKPMAAQNPQIAEELPQLRATQESDNEATFVRTPGVVSTMKSDGIIDFLTRKHNIKSLVICGVVTSGAVVSAAREAADLGFTVSVVEEACWDRTIEVHRAILDSVVPMTAWTVHLEDALTQLGP